MTDYALTLAAFDAGEARDRLRGATEVILRLEGAYDAAVKEAAETEAFYRLRMGEQFRAHRDAGAPVDAAMTMARGDTAPEKQATLKAAGMLRLAGEKLENARDTRRSLWRLVEWARDKDTAPPSGPAQQSFALANRGGASWPR